MSDAEPVPTVPLYHGGTGPERNAFLKRIADLKPLDEQGARAIVADVVKAAFSDLAVETLIKPLVESLGVSIPAARKFWKDAARAAREAAAAEAVRRVAEQRVESERESVGQRQAAAADERDRLWSSCREIAESPTLLADMEELVHELGVVGEGASIRGAYLAASSRLCRHGALCLLRRGAAAGGKNYLISKALRLIPDDAVIHMTSGSPLSLVYYGDGDEDAFKHKAIYIPEAAVLAERNGVESSLTFMLRTLISEGRLDHHVVLTQASGPPVSTHVKRNGPVVVIITTARDNVEDELLTRLVMSDADETGRQTKAVLKGVLAKEVRRVDEEEIRSWLDFQRWLEADAPYEVVIPFRPAILAAFNELWDEMRTVPLPDSPRRKRDHHRDRDVRDITPGATRERRGGADHSDARRLRPCTCGVRRWTGGALSDEDPGHRARRGKGGRGHGRDRRHRRQDHRFGADGETRDHRTRCRRLAAQSRRRVRFSQAGGHRERGRAHL